MPASRKRRRCRPRRHSPPSYVGPGPSAELGELEPWLETMVAVDDAERRGDAEEALLLMNSRLLGPDRQPFWRPARVSRLTQVVLLGSRLPRWAVSRWIVAQAHDWVAAPGDPARGEALARAIEVRGGTTGLSTRGEVDAQCKILDRDWVFRQLYLYELGGLERFLRTRATPDLLSGADRIHDWAHAPWPRSVWSSEPLASSHGSGSTPASAWSCPTSGARPS